MNNTYDSAYPTKHLLSNKKVKKHLYLSETTVSHVTEYMERSGLNPERDFSKAVESLVLMSLQDMQMLGVVNVMRLGMERLLQEQTNRLAKLLAHTAIEAGSAKEAVQQLLFWSLIDEKMAYEQQLEKTGTEPTPDGFEGGLVVDRNEPTGQLVIDLYESRKKRFRVRSVEALKKSAADWEAFLEKLNDEG